MKTIISISAILLGITFSAISSNYEEVMKSNIEKIYLSGTTNELTDLANRFERIASAESSEWLPAYYAAYCYVRSTFMEKMEAEQIHQKLDIAQKHIDKLMRSHDNESEIYTLQALVYQIRITDMSKGFKFSGMSNEALGVAEKLNPDNPRVYYLRGSNTFHTPKMFGGGAKNAKPYLEKASEMYKHQKPENGLMPTWGSGHINELLKMCAGD
jgi:hypothetical protein